MQFVELLKYLANIFVMRDHHVIVVALAVTFSLCFSALWVRKCMAVVLYQTKNGFSALCASSMNRSACSVTSSSMVSIRFFVSGPVSSIFCPPFPSAQQCSTPRGPKSFLNSGSLG